MRRVTCDAPVSLDRSVLVNKRTLLVYVTLDASSIGACRQSGLLELKSAVRIVTIAALHCAFKHLVMEREVELVFGLAVTTQAKLWLTLFEQLQIRYAWLLCVSRRDEDVRSRELSPGWRRMG